MQFHTSKSQHKSTKSMVQLQASNVIHSKQDHNRAKRRKLSKQTETQS